MLVTKLLLLCLLGLSVFDLQQCFAGFADYNIFRVDNTTVRVDFTITTLPDNAQLRLVKVSIKNQAPPHTPLCYFMHFDGTGVLPPGCEFQPERKLFSVTRTLNESEEEEEWELSATLLNSHEKLLQLITVKMPEEKTNPDGVKISVPQAGLSAGISGGVLLLVIVVVCIACKRRAAAASGSRVTYSSTSGGLPSVDRVRRGSTGYLKPLCNKPSSTHMYSAAPSQEEEIPYDNEDIALVVADRQVTYKTAKPAAAGKKHSPAVATAAKKRMPPAPPPAAAVAAVDIVDVVDGGDDGRGVYPEDQELYENTEDMGVNVNDTEELYENYD